MTSDLDEQIFERSDIGRSPMDHMAAMLLTLFIVITSLILLHTS